MSYRLQAPAAIAISALLGACQSTTAPAIQSASTELRSAPTSAILAGQGLHVDATIWRDFMPSSPPDGKPLIVIARIQADNGATVSGAVTADSLWVLLDGQAWAARAVEEQARAAIDTGFEVVARNGPKWGPGIPVDVVVRLRDGSGSVAYVRAINQLIRRTD